MNAAVQLDILKQLIKSNLASQCGPVMDALRPQTVVLPMALISLAGVVLYALGRWDVRRKRRAAAMERLRIARASG